CIATGAHRTVMSRSASFDETCGFNGALPTCEDYEMYLRIARGHPVLSHDRVVAEYRRHDAAMSMNPTRMLNGALGAFAGQRSFIEGKSDYLKAQQSGIRSMRRYAP